MTQQDKDQQSTLANILRGHQLRGLAYDGNPAYHVVIGKDWQALVRPENSVGYHSHVLALNFVSVAVCLVGNFNDDDLTDYQKNKLRDQLTNWQNKYQLGRDRILLHRNVHSTACPGANITELFITNLLGQEEINVKQLFRSSNWQREAAPGEQLYFIKRFEQGSIISKADMLNKMNFTHGKWAAMNAQEPGSGEVWWQREKNKVLLGE